MAPSADLLTEVCSALLLLRILEHKQHSIYATTALHAVDNERWYAVSVIVALRSGCYHAWQMFFVWRKSLEIGRLGQLVASLVLPSLGQYSS